MKQYRQEFIKVIDILKKFWDVIFVDFSGFYFDGYYNLVVIDKRIRYFEVMKIYLIVFQLIMEKFKIMFVIYGILRQL